MSVEKKHVTHWRGLMRRVVSHVYVVGIKAHLGESLERTCKKTLVRRGMHCMVLGIYHFQCTKEIETIHSIRFSAYLIFPI